MDEILVKFCIENGLPFAVKFPESWFKEYNLDTSAGHPIKDDDIVRHSSEKKRIKDKEP